MALEKICSITDIECRAITIRLFNKSIWANLGDGRFINRRSGDIQPINLLYRHARTAVASGGMVFAKRKTKNEALKWLAQPYKAKSW